MAVPHQHNLRLIGEYIIHFLPKLLYYRSIPTDHYNTSAETDYYDCFLTTYIVAIF